MSYVVDACIALKWSFAEKDSKEAIDLAKKYDLIAPDFILAEISNGIWKKVKKGERSPEKAVETFFEIQNTFSEIFTTNTLFPRVLTLSKELDHPVYDCIYLAAAEMRDVKLITADKEFHDKVKKSSYTDRIVWIKDFWKKKEPIQNIEREREIDRER